MSFTFEEMMADLLRPQPCPGCGNDLPNEPHLVSDGQRLVSMCAACASHYPEAV